jgi:hypothetical protein
MILVMLSMGYLSKKIITETDFKSLWIFDMNDFGASLQKYLPLISLGGTYVSVLIMLGKFFG